ncbi:MAG: formylmethanofuran dehydrogenase [Firmicutes bacterium ML8_F2]|nr:MAG: formylmethanofuran dehydrogenase [Firmicutes bacterium ML8_F2]
MPEWDNVVAFHGHRCMGLATGYRVAEAALQALQSGRDIDEELVAIVENDSCAVDAIQYVTGCTLGKGNLILRDYGKQAYNFARRSDGKALRIIPRNREGKSQHELNELRRKILVGNPTDEERERFAALNARAISEYLVSPLEDVVKIKNTAIKLPEKARIFNSITCAECGENVMEPRARVKNGQMVCIPCADSYER